MNDSSSIQALSLSLVLAFVATPARAQETARRGEARPNILFAIADDWGWPHAGAYGDPVVRTPAFDRLSREGVLFRHAYVSSPSCTPSRGAILRGEWHWRLGRAASLWSVFPDRFVTYPEILEQAGYAVGSSGKGWGPGRTESPGREPAGRRYRSFDDFLAKRPPGKPFCFWLGSSDPHRPYERGSGAARGMKLEDIRLPACFPDDPVVRGDIADYYFEVERFDRLVGEALAALERAGAVDDTIVLMTGDHGMPFPRGKANLYDTGTRVPLAVRWPRRVKPGREVDDFVSLTDLAPTYLEVAGLERPGSMTGRTLLSLLAAEKSGQIDPERAYVLFGKERHVPCQEAPDMGGYPCRALRTRRHLYIRNFHPERWPAGTPHWEKAAIPGAWLADCDNGPTKTYMVEHRDRDAAHRRLHDLAFAKRPLEELYDLEKDPGQLANLAADPSHAGILEKLRAECLERLRTSGDPRVLGGSEEFDRHPFLGNGPRSPEWEAREARKARTGEKKS
jgi:arylsulfatase A-like enzyme